MKRKCCADGVLNLPDEVEEALSQCGGLEGLRSSLTPEEVRERAAQIHSALSDPKRLMLMESLQYCDLCPCVLRELVGLGDSKLSYHLKLLEEADLISSRQSGSWRIYSLTSSGRLSLISLRRTERQGQR